MVKVNKGLRIINYLVDLLIIIIFSFVLMAISTAFGPTEYNNLLFFLVYFVYYVWFESKSGQTIGKKITNTIVVDLDNKKPKFIRIITRSLLRFNPIDGISYLFGQEQGSHDILSRTKLIDATQEKLK